MADAQITIKLTPDEFRTIIYALDLARNETLNTVDRMSPSDGKALRAMLIKLDDLKGKL